MSTKLKTEYRHTPPSGAGGLLWGLGGFRIAFRNLRRNALYSWINIVGLAAGIIASALILLWVEFQMNPNRDIPNVDYLYEIVQNQRYGDQVSSFFVSPGPLAEVLNNDFSGVRRSARFRGESMTFELAKDKIAFSESGAYTDSTLFSMISLPFIFGNPQTAFEPTHSIVISQRMAQKFFGNENPVGKNVKTNENLYEVTGVFKNRDVNGTFHFDWLIPLRVLEDELVGKGWINRSNWSSNWLSCFVEIEPGANVEDINQNLTKIFTERSSWGKDAQMFIYPVQARRLYGEFKDGKPTGGGYISTVRMFFWIGLLILLIACINFMNLSTARSQKRALEVGVRKTFGARRSRLIRRFMGESMMVTVMALSLALFLIYLLLPFFCQLVSTRLAVDFTNPYHSVGLLTIGALCALLAGFYPAFYLSSFSPNETLKKLRINVSWVVVWIRKGLVIFQFAVSFILICSTMVIYLQIHHMHNRPLGVKIDHLVYFSVPDEVTRNFAGIREQLVGARLATDAGLCSQRIISLNYNGGGYDWQGKAPNVDPLVSHVSVSWDLLKTAGIQFIEGSDFSDNGFGGKREVIINKAFADIMGAEGHVGGQLSRGEEPAQIIGIVENFVYNDMSNKQIGPVVFNPITEDAGYLFVRLPARTTESSTIADIKKILQSYKSGESLEPVYMNNFFDMFFSNYRFQGKLASLFAILAIFLSCLGLFGLSAFAAEQRTREIGIRKVLGASIGSIVSLLGRSFLYLESV